ncbi:Coxsackievirus and adenovirus receptor-like precursor [Silurus asotus]|uniref:Coxsackievirus and adenovirus receptor-like n=1 Tax=Silurus asotus TaxID=30991 RepID=A0AAD5B9W8_SILAS|nr:Coxsackievirus and adenovirus receptor-like precursor [Silurus asotus]
MVIVPDYEVMLPVITLSMLQMVFTLYLPAAADQSHIQPLINTVCVKTLQRRIKLGKEEAEIIVSVPLSVEGFEGDTVILPCLIKQKPDNVFWRFEKTRTMCDINNGEADFYEQDSAFKNRVGIFSSEIPLGNFSIKLSRVSNTDEGQYTCSAPIKDYRQEVQLMVKGVYGSFIVSMKFVTSGFNLF